MPVRPRPTVSLALGLALGATALIAGGASAGTPAMGVNGAPGLPCFTVEAMGSVAVTVTQKRNGTQIASATFVPATDGQKVCLKPLAAGDKLVIKQGEVQRTATVPALTAAVDLAANTVSGTTSLIGESVVVDVSEQLAGILTGASAMKITAPVGANGRFSMTMTPELDLQRGDVVRLDILTSTDEWRLAVTTGSMLVEVGTASARGTVAVGARASAVLKSPSGTVRGRFSVRSGRDLNRAGAFNAVFRKDGKAVKVRAGDRVTFSGSPRTLTVPARTLTVDASGSGSLAASCPAGGEWIALVDTIRIASGDTPSSGSVTVTDLLGLTTGEHVRLACSGKAGWVVMQDVAVP